MAAGYLVRLLEAEEFPAWDRMVEDSPQGTVYSKSFWFEALARIFGWQFKLYGFFKGESLAGGIGIFHARRWGQKVAFSPPLTPYTGVLIRGLSRKPGKELTAVQEVTGELIRVLEGEYAYLKLVHHWAYRDVRPFTWAGWETGVHYTFTLPLENQETLWQGLDYQVRKQINKGARQSLACYRSNDYETFWHLLEKTFAKQQLPCPIPGEKFFPLMELVAESCRLYLVKDREGRILAGRIILADRTGAQDWLAGADPAFLGTGATPFLLWHILQELAGEFSTLDLNGANIKSIARFKQNFGSILTPYYTTTKINSRLLKLGKTLKGLKLWN